MDGSMILVGETSKEDQSFEAFLWLRPFTTSVWLLTLFSILAAGVVYWILELIDPKSDRGRFRSPMKAVYLSFITFLGHFDDFQPNTVASRVLAVSLGKITSFILFDYSYCRRVDSSLTQLGIAIILLNHSINDQHCGHSLLVRRIRPIWLPFW